MTITLSALVDDIRDECGSVSGDFVKDEVIYKELKRANRYIGKIACSDTDEDDFKDALISLAAYYTYITYTALSARDLGDLPIEERERAETLKSLAYNDLVYIACIPITPNLNIDVQSIKSNLTSVTLTPSVYNDA